MPNTIRCACGFDVPFEEVDRGFEVYCPSCGQACLVPAAPAKGESDAAGPSGPHRVGSAEGTATAPTAPGASSQRQSYVFSAQAAERISQQTLHRVSCLCGEEIPVRVEDFGLTVYCPRCGAEVPVGESLDRRAPASQARQVKDEEGAGSAPVPKARIKWIGSPIGVLVLLLIVASTAAAAYFTWDNRTEVVQWMREINPLKRKPSRPSGPVQFDPNKVTIQAIEALREQDDPFQALLFVVGWQQGLRKHGVPETDPRFARLREIGRAILDEQKATMLQQIDALRGRYAASEALQRAREWMQLLRALNLPSDDPRLAKLDRLARKLVEQVEPITLEMIAALLKKADAEKALVQARLWQEALLDRKAPPNDPRFARLKKVVAALTDRLAKPADEQADVIARFRRAVDQLSSLLRAGTIDKAQQMVATIEQMLRDHADLLSPLTARYLKLKAILQQQQLRSEGYKLIRSLLQQAERAADSGDSRQVTDARVAKAKAKFLARSATVTTPQANELRELTDRLSPKVQFAVGKRAVAEAKQCDAAGDPVARDREVRRAYDQLQGLPEGQIRPYLKQIRQWKEAATNRAKTSRRAPASSIGRRIHRRDLFESALEPYSAADGDRLADACRNYHDALTDAQRQSDPRYAQLREMLFDVLEAQLTQLVAGKPDATGGQSPRNAAALRQALEKVAFWNQSPRWKALDGALRQRGQDWARRALEQATELAANHQWQQALDRLEAVRAAGHPSTVKKAEQLRKRWQQEIDRQTRQAAEAASLDKIRKLMKENDYLACWKELDQFIRLYPDSEHVEKAKQIKSNIEAFVLKQFAQQVQYIDTLMDDGKWPEAFRQLQLLESTAMNDAQRSVLGPVQAKAEKQKEQIRKQYRSLGRRRNMRTPAEIIAVRQIVQLMLLIDPDHREARQLLDEAKRRGSQEAAKLLQRAERFKNTQRGVYRSLLQRAAELDPTGTTGKKAQQMLDQM